MKKTKYTEGFEKFWKVWKKVTGNESDKPEAFKYWKRDKLENDTDELIRILLLQADERKRVKSRGFWQPGWCFCRKWLNKRRYEYIPEPPKKRKTTPVSYTPREEIYSPEQRKKWREYQEFVRKTTEGFKK